LADTAVHYSSLIKRAITGLILGAIVGAIELWFFNHDLAHFLAAVVAGPLYMTSLAVFVDRHRLAGGKILLGSMLGVIAAIVWWAIAVQATDQFIFATVAGGCFGAAYVWSESRKRP
jgi:ABC-type cobalamin transport system permease subunit